MPRQTMDGDSCNRFNTCNRSSSRARVRAGLRLGRLMVLAAVLWSPAVPAGPAGSSSFVLSQSTVNAGGQSYAAQSSFWTSLSVRSYLRIEAAGSGRGSVSAMGVECSVDGSSATGDCGESVFYGSSIALLATPLTADSFDGWIGCDDTSTTVSAGDTCWVALRGSRTVTVGFRSGEAPQQSPGRLFQPVSSNPSLQIRLFKSSGTIAGSG